MSRELQQVWITGIGLVSSLGEGVAEHWQRLCDPDGCIAAIESTRFAPYTVHPLAPLEFARQIPRTSDQRQMERWHRIGVYAAGLALTDAGMSGNEELLDRTDLSIAAGNGERDVALDSRILATIATHPEPGPALNHELMTGLRPTLYLGQLSNLLAGNISIVHGATGASRTFKGEEMAGVSALQNAVERIENGEGDIVLVGGALNAERDDLLLGCELEQMLYRGPFAPVWERREMGGGAILGSVGAFLVLESANHARARGRNPYARIVSIHSERSRRGSGEACAAAEQMFARLGLTPCDAGLPVLSGASGVEPATADEMQFIARLKDAGSGPIVRAWSSLLGQSREAQFLVGMALAAISIAKGAFYPPFCDSPLEPPATGVPENVLVTTFGSWRGEAMGLVAPAI